MTVVPRAFSFHEIEADAAFLWFIISKEFHKLVRIFVSFLLGTGFERPVVFIVRFLDIIT